MKAVYLKSLIGLKSNTENKIWRSNSPIDIDIYLGIPGPRFRSLEREDLRKGPEFQTSKWSKNFDFCYIPAPQGRGLDPCRRSRRDASELGRWRLCRRKEDRTLRRKWWLKETQELEADPQLKQGNFSSLWPFYPLVMYAPRMIDRVWIIRWIDAGRIHWPKPQWLHEALY